MPIEKMPAGTVAPPLAPDSPEFDGVFEVEGEEIEEELLEEEGPANFSDNLVDFIDDGTLDDLGSELVSLVEADKATMAEWEQIYVDGMKLLGLEIKNLSEEVFPDSCTATHPVLMESITKFQAKARSQILRPDGIARAKIVGRVTDEKKAQAERVAEFLNWQVDDQMPEYGPEHDKMLFHQAFSGSAYTKISYDASLGRPFSKFIAPQKFIIDYDSTDLESAYRYTEVIDINANDLRRSQLDGLYRQVDVSGDERTGMGTEIQQELDKIEGRSRSEHSQDQEVYQLYEIHTYLALDEIDDRLPEEEEIGLELPYIVTVDSSSKNVLAIRRNWREGDLRYNKRVWYTHWVFIPGMGFQGFGYIHIIGGLARTATTSLRQLVDSGSFSILQGGFKAHGLRVVGTNEPLSPGEWRDVQSPGQDLTKALLPLPYKEPSGTVLALLEFISAAAQRFADSTEQVVSESTNYGPVGTTMALLEASGRLFTGIHERLFEAQKRELNILMEINFETLPEQYPFEMVGGEQVIARDDFSSTVNVIPATDPREPSAAHRVARANATLTIAAQFPELHNMPAILKDLHMALGAEDPQRYMKQNQKPVPLDPVTENQLMLNSAPVGVGPEQNHMAHIKVHLAIVNNPTYSQNPKVTEVVMAHVQDHLAENFRQEVQQQIGPLPEANMQKPLPPEQENQIALAAANAMDQISPPSLDEETTELMIKERKQALDEKKASHDATMDFLELAQEDQHHDEKLLEDKRETNKKADTQLEVAQITKRDRNESSRPR